MIRILPALILQFLATTTSAQTRIDRMLKVTIPLAAPMQQWPASSPARAPAPAAHQRPRASRASYSATAMGATIVAKNADYETVFKVHSSVPPRSAITHVSWRYGLSSKPAGFEAFLCQQNQRLCVNITNNASGSALDFNGSDATQAFTLHYRVKGRGELGPPAQGQMNQIIVSYD